MFLVDYELIEMGIDPDYVNPTSYDLTVGGYRRLKKEWLQIGSVQDSYTYWNILGQPNIFLAEDRHKFWDKERVLAEGEVITISPWEPMLMVTREIIKIGEQQMGIMLSKSTIGRAFLEHFHAGFFDAGFEGQATLEVMNLAPFPIQIVSGQRLVQMVTFESSKTPLKIYKGRYKNLRGAEPPRGT